MLRNLEKRKPDGIQANLAEFSKEAYGSKRAVLSMMMMMMMFKDVSIVPTS
jgi:hypothetical protein